jgi:hypothetical protein
MTEMECIAAGAGTQTEEPIAGRREDFDHFLAAVPDSEPEEPDQLSH